MTTISSHRGGIHLKTQCQLAAEGKYTFATTMSVSTGCVFQPTSTSSNASKPRCEQDENIALTRSDYDRKMPDGDRTGMFLQHSCNHFSRQVPALAVPTPEYAPSGSNDREDHHCDPLCGGCFAPYEDSVCKSDIYTNSFDKSAMNWPASANTTPLRQRRSVRAGEEDMDAPGAPLKRRRVVPLDTSGGRCLHFR
jgi:hypothetical protein